jgi:hypothetical protein
MAQTIEALKAEIAGFKPLHETHGGTRWTHFPERIVDGLTKVPGIRCACGKMFASREWEVPTDQPAPALWGSFQGFKAHIAEVTK